MPYLTITSNQDLGNESGQLQKISKTIAELSGKSESYVMVSTRYNPDMLFAGSSEALAYCEFKSLGLQESQTSEFSNRICECIFELYNIPKSRIYIEFSAPSRAMWGWDSKTF